MRTLKWALHENGGLRFGLYWQLLLLVFSMVAFPYDHRRVLGLNPWVKPIKFELSAMIFLSTMALVLHRMGLLRVHDDREHDYRAAEFARCSLPHERNKSHGRPFLWDDGTFHRNQYGAHWLGARFVVDDPDRGPSVTRLGRRLWTHVSAGSSG